MRASFLRAWRAAYHRCLGRRRAVLTAAAARCRPLDGAGAAYMVFNLLNMRL